MADISSPQAIKFCSESVRPLADDLVMFYYAARRVRDRYISIGAATLIPNETASKVLDGADVNGKPIVTGADVNVALAVMAEVLTLLEANDSVKLQQLLKVAPGDGAQIR